MISIDELSYAYPGGMPAISSLTAEMPGGLVLLAGANGSGKSTLLKLLAGLIRPSGGKIRVSTRKDEAMEGGEAELRRISRLVMQDADMQLLGATLAEDIALGRSGASDKKGFGRLAAELADRLGLGRLLERSTEELSYGQKRKLCLLHALAAGPSLLLLDEPFAELDYPTSRELRAIIDSNRGTTRTQIVSTHDLEPLFDIADWMLVLEDGQLAGQGKPHEIAPRLAEWSVRPPTGGWRS